MTTDAKRSRTYRAVRTIARIPYNLVRFTFKILYALVRPLIVVPYNAVRTRISERRKSKNVHSDVHVQEDVQPERVQVYIPESVHSDVREDVQEPERTAVQGQDVQPEHVQNVRTGRVQKIGMYIVYGIMSVLLASVIASPIALSAQNIVGWAAGDGLGLGEESKWRFVPFLALDAAAATCILMMLICTWKGEQPGVFRLLAWVFTASAAAAGYSEGTGPHAPGKDTFWFMPLMSILGPVMLEVVLARAKGWIRRADGRRAEQPPGMSDYGWSRWMPGIGAFTETFGSWRLAKLAGISNVQLSVDLYRQLMPTGGFKIAKAWRTAQLVRTEHGRSMRTSIVVERVYLNAPVQDSVHVQDVRTPDVQPEPVHILEPVQAESVHVQEPVQPERPKVQNDVHPERPSKPERTTSPSKNWVVQKPRAIDDTERLQKIREAFPGQLPNKSKIRTLLSTNNDIAGRLLEKLEKEMAQ